MDSSVVQEYNKQQKQKPRRRKDIDNDRPMLTGWGVEADSTGGAQSTNNLGQL